jgi:methylmalonyl-CoA mutase cobalamin-binding domain/chain
MSDYEQLQASLTDLLLNDDVQKCADWIRQTLEAGVPPIDFFDQVFTPAMAAVGDKFGRLEIFLPELMDTADKAKAVSESVLKPAMAAAGAGGGGPRGKVVICSVQGDLHDIGKNMVSLMLQVNGFEVIDLGINVRPRDALNKAKEVDADILGLSSLMTTSMPYMKECVELRDGLGMKDEFFVIVGGAPITSAYCEEIGADAFGRDAIEGVVKCLALMERRK